MLLQSDVYIWNKPIECLPRPQLDQLQLTRLKELVSRLAAKVPFYRDALAKHKVSAQDIGSLDDVRRLPFTTKANLRDGYPFGFLAADKGEMKRIHASSGTRGKPTIAAYTQGDLDSWAELVARCLAATGCKPGDVIHNAYGYGLFTGGLGLHAGAEKLGATIVPSSSGRTQQQIMLLSDLCARVLCCTPSYALNIAATMQDTGVSARDLKLEIGIFGAEPWSEECRRQIEAGLALKAFDIYGISELAGPGVAIECIARDGLHIFEDQFLVEIIDPETLEPVEPGETGELVVTTLSKEALPLLRYRTGDACALLNSPCSCGRTMHRISRIQGRLDDMLIIRGVNVYPCEIEAVLYSLSGLSPQYQVVIDRAQAMDSLKVRAELTVTSRRSLQTHADGEMVARRKLETSICDALKQRLGLTALVELLDPDTLPRSEGKAHRILDMRSRT